MGNCKSIRSYQQKKIQDQKQNNSEKIRKRSLTTATTSCVYTPEYLDLLQNKYMEHLNRHNQSAKKYITHFEKNDRLNGNYGVHENWNSYYRSTIQRRSDYHRLQDDFDIEQICKNSPKSKNHLQRSNLRRKSQEKQLKRHVF